jgi:hypothetical protein
MPQTQNDVAFYGALGDGETDCTAAFLAALAQNAHVTISSPGTYVLNATLVLGSGQSIEGTCDGVVLVRGSVYGAMIANSNYTSSGEPIAYDLDIAIKNLTLSDGEYAGVIDVVPTFSNRGMVQLCWVERFVLDRVVLISTGSALYLVKLFAASGGFIRNVTNVGTSASDAFHLNGRCHDISFVDCAVQSADDGYALNSVDWPGAGDGATFGDIHNINFVNCRAGVLGADPQIDVRGYFSRLLTGSWLENPVGRTYSYGDCTLSGGNIYQVMSSETSGVTSTVAPTHVYGCATDVDGITWCWVGSGDITSTNIYDINFVNCTSLDGRRIVRSIGGINFTSTEYPGTEMTSFVDNINILGMVCPADPNFKAFEYDPSGGHGVVKRNGLIASERVNIYGTSPRLILDSLVIGDSSSAIEIRKNGVPTWKIGTGISVGGEWLEIFNVAANSGAATVSVGNGWSFSGPVKASGAFLPNTSGALDLGDSAHAFRNCYLTAGLAVNSAPTTNYAFRMLTASGGSSFWLGCGAASGWQVGSNTGSGSDDSSFGFYSEGGGPALGYRPVLLMTVDGSSYFVGPMLPFSDNAKALGASANRWSVVYAGTGTINTSDATQKTNVRVLSEAEIACGIELAQQACVYQWADAVAEKGENAARLHVGFIANSNTHHPLVLAVQEICARHGIDPERWGFFCKDPATVRVPKSVVRQIQKTEYRTREAITVIDGMPVLKNERYEVPVFEARQVRDTEGRVVFDDNGTPRTYECPVMIDLPPEVHEEIAPDLNPDGTQKFVYGLRYTELLSFIVACFATKFS